jgi:hypothetical protein
MWVPLYILLQRTHAAGICRDYMLISDFTVLAHIQVIDNQCSVTRSQVKAVDTVHFYQTDKIGNMCCQDHTL